MFQSNSKCLNRRIKRNKDYSFEGKTYVSRAFPAFVVFRAEHEPWNVFQETCTVRDANLVVGRGAPETFVKTVFSRMIGLPIPTNVAVVMGAHDARPALRLRPAPLLDTAIMVYFPAESDAAAIRSFFENSVLLAVKTSNLLQSIQHQTAYDLGQGKDASNNSPEAAINPTRAP